MTSITIHGGASEIGGNKILIDDGKTRLFLDFGKNYSAERRFFDFPLLRPREEKHLLSLGFLPPIEGLYKQDKAEPNVDGIVVSHAHGDHWDYIRFVDDSIPIYCGEATETIIRAREESGRLGPSKEYYVANLTQSRGQEVFKDFKTLDEGKESAIGSFGVSRFPVDHSIPGANGLVVATKHGPIAYSGDLRLHGREGKLTEEFIKKASGYDPALLIIEGTNIIDAPMSCEHDVQESLQQIVEVTPNLVMAGFSVTDCCRLETFMKVAENTERTLTISMKQAYLLHRLNQVCTPPMPIETKIFAIYRRQKKTTYEYESIIEEKYGNVIEAKDVSASPEEHILVANLYDFNELVDIRPDPGSVYIHSMSEPFNEEMRIDYGKLVNWLAEFGLPSYQLHATGHARPHELKEIIREINPKKVMLVHTEHPFLYERYIENSGIDTIIPLKGKSNVI
jgi:ribonuclease J